MKETTSLLFGIHCHQPVDNFDWVLKQAIEKSYKPFFYILKEFPEFKCAVHFSGWLLEYIQEHDDELFSLMQSLSNQIEFFSGGYYEPVLASIPSRDRIGQISKLNRYIKKHFDQHPKGLWLTERVWDDSIISDIKQCGIKYVVVDDYHIKLSGVKTENTNGFFITESGGEEIALFPINQALRYAIPFFSLEDTNKLLRSFAKESGKNAAIIFDDGEKFGIWPKTYETVYEKQWLRNFFTQTLADESIKVETFNEYYNANKPIDLAYLSGTSYAEMGEWALTNEDNTKLEFLLNKHPQYNQFIRGGIWKNFFNKYQESNWLHKRFLELSKKQTNSNNYKDALYKSQANDVLWHGVFGGVYLPNLRDNAYKYIIECEKILENSKEKLDIDLNGYDDFKYNTKQLLTIVSVKNGGQIFELDILDKNFNIQNTLTRYEESYHKKIEVKQHHTQDNNHDELSTIHDNKLYVENNLFLDYDWYLKKSAIDHIIDTKTNISNFLHNLFDEYGDFANQPYEVTKHDTKQLSLTRDGGIYRDDKKYDTTINKKYTFRQNTIKLDIGLSSTNSEKLKYMQEWNLHFADVSMVTFNDATISNDKIEQYLDITTDRLVIYDNYLKKTITFTFDRKIELYVLSLNSVSQSEQGVDITNQGVTIGLLYDFTKTLDVSVEVKIS